MPGSFNAGQVARPGGGFYAGQVARPGGGFYARQVARPGGLAILEAILNQY